MSHESTRVIRAAYVLNAVLAMLIAWTAVIWLREPYAGVDMIWLLAVATAAPSLMWLIAMKFSTSFSASLLALVANAVGISASMFAFFGFVFLGAATGTRADPEVLGFSFIWLIAAALNFRTVWVQHFVRRRHSEKHAK
jgi:hypothetical protein